MMYLTNPVAVVLRALVVAYSSPATKVLEFLPSGSSYDNGTSALTSSQESAIDKPSGIFVTEKGELTNTYLVVVS